MLENKTSNAEIYSQFLLKNVLMAVGKLVKVLGTADIPGYKNKKFLGFNFLRCTFVKPLKQLDTKRILFQ